MSFRQFGGLNYAPKHNIVVSNYNTSNNLLVTQNVGQPNSYINFLSDISGNITIYGDVDISGNLHVKGDADISGNTNIGGSLDVSGNVDIYGNTNIGGSLDVSGNIDIYGNTNIGGSLDVSGNITANYMFLSSYPPNYASQANAVMPKAYIDSVGGGIIPFGPVKALSTYDSSVGTTTFPVPIDPSNISLPFYIDGYSVQVGDSVLLNDQSSGVNNGIYDLSYNLSVYYFIRSSKMANGTNAKGASVTIQQGTTHERSIWVQTQDPAIVGTNSLLFQQFYSFNYRLGQGLSIVNAPNNEEILFVDSSLNFLTLVDASSSNPTLNIGTENATTINIGKSNTTSYLNLNGNTNISSGNFNVNNNVTLANTSGNVTMGGAAGTSILGYINSTIPSTSSAGTLILQTASSAGSPSSKLLIGSNQPNNYSYLQSYNTTNTVGKILLNPNGGSIGINTLTPNSNYALDVSGNIRIINAGVLYPNNRIYGSAGSSDNFWIGIQPPSGGGGKNLSIGMESNDGSTVSGLRFMTDGADRLYIDASGHVGIGTTSPNYLLDVNGNGNFSGGNFYLSNLFFQGDGTNAYIRPFNSNSYLYLGANNINYAAIASNGSFGIGTTAPNTLYSLDVSGSLHSPNGDTFLSTISGYVYMGTNSGNGGAKLYMNGNINYSQYNSGRGFNIINGNYSNNPTGAELTIAATNQSYSFIQAWDSSSNSLNNLLLNPNGGYVGIGKIPSYALDVSGNGNFTGNVSASSFSTPSDYRIKDNIQILNDSHIVDNLRPITYFNKKTEKQDIGLLAHELQEHFPCLVFGEKDDEEFQTVNYTGLIPILIKEIQELKKEIKLLKEKI